MKKKITAPNQDIATEHRISDKELPLAAQETNKAVYWWFAAPYCPVLMPMTDFSFVFDELKNIYKKWGQVKEKLPIIYKKSKEKYIFFAAGLLVLLVAESLQAQSVAAKPLSLEEIWKAVESHNRTIKLSDLSLQQSRLEVLEARDRQLPELSLGADAKLNSRFLIYDNGLFSSPQNVPVKNYGYTAGYNMTFNLYNGGKDRRNVAMKKEEEIQKQYESDLQKHSIKFNSAAAYFDLYKFLHFYEFLQAEIETEKKQMSLIESLHKNGAVLKSDVLRISVKLSQLELSRSDIEKKIQITKQRLNILMGRDMDEQLSIPYQNDISAERFTDEDYSAYTKTALSQSPEYAMSRSEIKWSELNIKQNKAALMPKVVLYSNYNYNYPQISFYPYSDNLWGFGQTGIKLQYSIDNLYKSNHSISRAESVKNQAEEKAQIIKDEILLRLKEAYLQQQQALESVTTAENNISKSNETVRVIKSSYLNQESLLTDLLEAENALLEAKFNLTTAQTNVKLSQVRIMAITGTL